MQQLDKKAVWLFFLSTLVRSISVSFIGIVWIIAMLAEGALSEDGLTSGLLFAFYALLALFLVVGIISYIWAKLTYHYYRYDLSELVFKKEHGVIYKKYVSIPYDRIQNVDIHRGILARLLGLSDLQIQTAGGISMSSYGAFSEGRLVGLSKEEAERLRDEVIQRSRSSRNGQGL